MADFSADFKELNRVLATASISLAMLQRLAAVFPELTAALDARLRADIGPAIEKGDIALLEAAESRGLLGDYVRLIAHATTVSQNESARWLVSKMKEKGLRGSEIVASAGELGINPSAIALILRTIPLDKKDRMDLVDLAVQQLFSRIEMADVARSSLQPEDVDARMYPLVRKYFETSRRPPRRVLGKPPHYGPRARADFENSLKSAMWILRTANAAYPDDKIYESYNTDVDPNVAELFKTLALEASRVYRG